MHGAPSNMQHLVWIALIPTVAMLAGSFLVLARKPGNMLTASMLHFAAGTLLAATSLELLPEVTPSAIKDWTGYLSIGVGFSVGVTLMIIINQLCDEEKPPLLREDAEHPGGHDMFCARVPSVTPQIGTPQLEDVELDTGASPEKMSPETQEDAERIAIAKTTSPRRRSGLRQCAVCRLLARVPWGTVLPVSVNAFMDGIVLGISFIAGGIDGGAAMGVALAVEMCFLGVSTSIALKLKETPLWLSLVISVVLPFIMFGSAFMGATVMANLPYNIHQGVTAFGIASLVFFCCDELLVEAHSLQGPNKTWWVNVPLYLGFASVLLLEYITSEFFNDDDDPNAGASSLSSVGSFASSSSSSV
eukprot:TRINITY_DN4547_c0_g1_i1.p1 TRINITY_DN4547_c0_g1~~TRINITY_DN4547_c0_g1_i1.p1  ORF type:complete len:360 (-),score=98.76 TRINITY_DN4547_c0_g1_i1:42-1121(-)